METSQLVNDERIIRFRELINERLAGIYTEGPDSLVQSISYVLKGGGKRLRPILTLIASETCGGTIYQAMPSALAVEILHNFTLVHDDIMDEDTTRHGQPTVHEKWDVGYAILTGDAMLSLALKILQTHNNPSRLMTVFTDGLLRVCEGQTLDKEFETREDVTLDEYIHMIDLKTGYLLGLSAEMGAISANADESEVKAVRDYARLVGRAFQVQDDLLEIYSNAQNMGKSLKSDILLGKKTFLMINAREFAPEEVQAALEITQNDFSTGQKILRRIFEEKGVTKLTKDYVADTIRNANEKLKGVTCDTGDLLYFSNVITRRNH